MGLLTSWLNALVNNGQFLSSHFLTVTKQSGVSFYGGPPPPTTPRTSEQ